MAQTAYGSLIHGDVAPVVGLVEQFWSLRPIQTLQHSNEEALRTTLEALWYDPDSLTCIPELRLVQDHRVAYGHGLYGFVDLVIPGAESISCLELKNCTLENLWHGEHDLNPLRRAFGTEETWTAFREKLRTETEDQLLERKVRYWNAEAKEHQYKTVAQLKLEATRQVNSYLETMKSGLAGPNSNGVLDSRLKCEQGKAKLIGYVVIGLGGTRALGYVSKTEEIMYSYFT